MKVHLSIFFKGSPGQKISTNEPQTTHKLVGSSCFILLLLFFEDPLPNSRKKSPVQLGRQESCRTSSAGRAGGWEAAAPVYGGQGGGTG